MTTTNIPSVPTTKREESKQGKFLFSQKTILNQTNEK